LKMIYDVSKWQGDVDWTKVEAEFVILRASVGTSTDAKYARNAAGAAKRGIPYHAYHFLKAVTTHEAMREASAFYDAVKGTAPLFLVIDIEYGKIYAKAKRDSGFTQRILDAFEDQLRWCYKQDGSICPPIAVYIGHHVYKACNVNTAKYAYVWIPRSRKQPAFYCDLHQYGQERKQPGFRGKVDVNKLNGDKPLEFFTEKKYRLTIVGEKAYLERIRAQYGGEIGEV
jgi:N-acetylmuramoyl-L-alanine amidase